MVPFAIVVLVAVLAQAPRPVPLQVKPSQVSLQPGALASFSAEGLQGTVVWSVAPGEGWIAWNGEYKAPDKPGVYRVRARGTKEGEAEATVEVMYRPRLRVSATRGPKGFPLEFRVEPFPESATCEAWIESTTMRRSTALRGIGSVQAPEMPGLYVLKAAVSAFGESVELSSVEFRVEDDPSPWIPRREALVPNGREPHGESVPITLSTNLAFPGDEVVLSRKGPTEWWSSVGSWTGPGKLLIPVQTREQSITVFALPRRPNDAMSWIGVQPITLVAGPSEAMCGPGKFVKFAALASRGPVVWEVVDAEGGEFRGDGKFIAPPKPGTYHVRARSLWDPKVAEELTVEVEAGMGDYLADFDPPRSPARPEAKGLSLVPPLVKLDAGTYMSFSASQYQEPDDGPPEAQLQWTAHSLTGTGTATVDRDGVFTASAPGLYEIRIASLQHPERWARAIALVEPSIKPVKGVPSDLSDRTMAGHAALATGETFIVAGRNKALQPIGTCYLRSVDGTGFTRNVDLLGPRWEPLVAALQGGQVLVLGGTGTWKDPSGLVKEGAVPFAEFLDPAARQRVPLPKPVPGAYNGETPSRHVGGSLTALRDGTALACGGGRKAGDPTGPSFLFNPVSGRFEPLEGPDLGQGHAALLLDDGRVFLCGGLDAGGRPSAQCWFFDPRTRRFNAAGTMTMGRAWHAATGLGYAGQILISGGVIEGGRDKEGTSGRPTATCELFKLATGQCVRTGSMNHPRAEHAGVCLPTGQVLVLGGWGKGRKGGPPYYPGVSEDYSSDSAIWSVRDTQPYGVKHPVLLLLQMGNVFLTGEPVASTVPKD